MSELSTFLLVIILIGLVLFSGFFSASEIGMMSLNRYRLRNLVRKNNKSAIRVDKLLKRSDKLLSAILIGNTFANIFASSVTTVLAVRLYGDMGVAIATFLLTLVILIFAEITPKTLAAQNPQRIAFWVALPLLIFMRLVKPCIALANGIAKKLLYLFGVDFDARRVDALNSEELRTVVRESGDLISAEHKNMLLSILDLDNASILDIMVPRHEIVGIDIESPWEVILSQLETSQYTRLPIYRDNIDNLLGVVHVRRLLNHMADKKLNLSRLMKLMDDMYCILESTPLMTQLIKFRENRERFAFVVDEYGAIQGVLTLDDILEEIVGEFTTTLASTAKGIYREIDGSMIVDGSMSIRDLNRIFKMQLPEKGPKTLSGLITEELHFIPPVGIGLLIGPYPVEVIQVKDNVVKTARIKSALLTTQKKDP